MAASAMPDGSCQVAAIDDPILLRRLIDMVEALASDRANQPFNMTVLPR
jgi:hypothetical protein